MSHLMSTNMNSIYPLGSLGKKKKGSKNNVISVGNLSVWNQDNELANETDFPHELPELQQQASCWINCLASYKFRDGH